MPMSPEAFFQALADPTRLRLLVLLAGAGELCVCELAHALAAPQPRVSRHLGHLRQAGLVRGRRAGQWVHYRLAPGLPPWARRVLRATAQGLGGEPPFAEDRARLEAMPDRPGRSRCA